MNTANDLPPYLQPWAGIVPAEELAASARAARPRSTARRGCLAALLGVPLVLVLALWQHATGRADAGGYTEPPAADVCPICGVLWLYHTHSCTDPEPDMDPDSDYWGDLNWPTLAPAEGRIVLDPVRWID